jgi:hypothetical protein
MPLSPSRVLRQFRHALFFDGVDDYVLVSSAMIGSVVSTTPLTFNIILYVFPERGRTFTYISTFTRAYYGFVLQKIDVNRLTLFVGTGSSWVRSEIDASRFGWFDATGVISSTAVSYYVNASLINTLSLPRYQPGSTTLGIGTHPVTPPYFPAKAFIARVLLYSRALSDSEIQFNYNNPDNPVRNDLVLWFRAHPDYVKDIDGDGLLEWLDLSGYGNHGKIYGATLVKLIRDPVR